MLNKTDPVYNKFSEQYEKYKKRGYYKEIINDILIDFITKSFKTLDSVYRNYVKYHTFLAAWDNNKKYKPAPETIAISKIIIDNLFNNLEKYEPSLVKIFGGKFEKVKRLSGYYNSYTKQEKDFIEITRKSKL